MKTIKINCRTHFNQFSAYLDYFNFLFFVKDNILDPSNSIFVDLVMQIMNHDTTKSLL